MAGEVEFDYQIFKGVFTMSKKSRFDKDSEKYNRLYAIDAICRELARQNPMMTLAELERKATELYDSGYRASRV